MTSLAPSPDAIRRAYQEELGPGQRSALLSWLAFTGTFAGLRALTYGIRTGRGPFRNVSRTPLVLGQWGKGARFKYELTIVNNEAAPNIPVGGSLKPMPA